MSYTLVLPTLDGASIFLSSGLIDPEVDGMFSISLNLEDIPNSFGIRRFSVMIDWLDADGNFLWSSPYNFTIAESGAQGDFDRDGERTVHDPTAFLDAYANNAPRADRNGDRVVNAADLALFLAEYDTE